MILNEENVDAHFYFKKFWLSLFLLYFLINFLVFLTLSCIGLYNIPIVMFAFVYLLFTLLITVTDYFDFQLLQEFATFACIGEPTQNI